MKGDFNWEAPATLLLFVGKEGATGEGDPGFVPLQTGTVSDLIGFYSRCGDWVQQQSRLVVPGVLDVGGYDIGDLRDRLDHAN